MSKKTKNPKPQAAPKKALTASQKLQESFRRFNVFAVYAPERNPNELAWRMGIWGPEPVERAA